MITVTTENWQTRANCRDTDPDTMQPEVATRAEVMAAKAVCDGCPVKLQCKTLADEQAGAYGVHAGEWYGPDPAPVLFCGWCNTLLSSAARSTRSFCNDTCRKRAARAAEYAARTVA